MLAHDLRYRTGSVPWGLVTVLAALMLLLLGLGRITMDARGFQRSAESQLRSRFQLMQQMAPPGSRVLAWQSDPVTRDVVVVLLRDAGGLADWRNLIVLWDRVSVPGVLVGVADRPIDLPLESAGTEAWRRFLMDVRVRLLPVVRPDALGILNRPDPSGIGPLVRVDACLESR
ncbi:hypothetical protein OAL71_02975 [Phycisphaerales bacterium]|nr:hypothetical protein [Phycisphaerales bacterium]RPG14496.1 MAG: hypothetical protein CBB69_011700 [Phycisphaera sp. TMED9]